MNPLTAPQNYLVTHGKPPNPRLGLTGLNYLTVYQVVKAATTGTVNLSTDALDLTVP